MFPEEKKRKKTEIKRVEGNLCSVVYCMSKSAIFVTICTSWTGNRTLGHRNIPVVTLLHDSGEYSGWYTLPISHSSTLFCYYQNQTLPPLPVTISVLPCCSYMGIWDKLECQFFFSSYISALLHSLTADSSVFSFVRKLWQRGANQSCALGHVRTGSHMKGRSKRKKNNVVG